MNNNEDHKRAIEIVNRMMDKDAFSQWLGIEVEDIETGRAKLAMTVRNDMLNGFLIAHGGIAYSLADSALAFASNSHGQKSVSIETSISHILPCEAGDRLTAHAKEIHRSTKLGVYDIRIVNQKEQEIALFKGTVYRTRKEW